MKIARCFAVALFLGCGLGTLGCVANVDEGASALPPGEPTASATEAVITPCATLYADARWMGASLAVAATAANLPASFNDVTSSVTVKRGCTLILYADANWSGMAVTFNASSATVPPAFNDQASSYDCSCPVTCAPGYHYCGDPQGCVPVGRVCW